MATLKEEFDNIRADLEGGGGRSIIPLLNLMHKANDGVREFNAAALEKHDINPAEAMMLWATGFARGTLGYHQGTENDVVASRCAQCLDEETGYKFGLYLDDALKARLAERYESIRREPFVQPSQRKTTVAPAPELTP